MLDFKEIISGVAGQRETFEELVCQIARRIPPEHAVEFRRIHGAGGDGGVEAIWLLSDGHSHGYQAKFHTSSAEVDWGAIDKSVRTALAMHPKLTAMTIAIACSLTGRTGRVTKQGKPAANGWDAWDLHKSRWEAEAKALGRNVSFAHWTAPDLEEMLTRPEAIGLVDYWFGKVELSEAWFRRFSDRAIASLEERYHPEDHVDVETQSVFDGLLRNSRFRTRLREARENILSTSALAQIPEVLTDSDRIRIAQVMEQTNKLLAETRALESETHGSLDYEKWDTDGSELRHSIYEAVNRVLELARDGTINSSASSDAASERDADIGVRLDYLVESLRKLQSTVWQFLALIDSTASRSDLSRFSILDGRAGSGKSHLMASQVEQALRDKAPALFLLGTDFTLNGTVESQILAYLELKEGVR